MALSDGQRRPGSFQQAAYGDMLACLQEAKAVAAVQSELEAFRSEMQRGSNSQRQTGRAAIAAAVQRAERFVDRTLRLNNLSTLSAYVLGQGPLPVSRSFQVRRCRLPDCPIRMPECQVSLHGERGTALPMQNCLSCLCWSRAACRGLFAFLESASSHCKGACCDSICSLDGQVLAFSSSALCIICCECSCIS